MLPGRNVGDCDEGLSSNFGLSVFGWLRRFCGWRRHRRSGEIGRAGRCLLPINWPPIWNARLRQLSRNGDQSAGCKSCEGVGHCRSGRGHSSNASIPIDHGMPADWTAICLHLPMRWVEITAIVTLGWIHPALAEATATDFDVACVIASGWEMATASTSGRDMGFAPLIHYFYLGRLTARDDSKDWIAFVTPKMANPDLKNIAPKLMAGCSQYLTSKLPAEK